VVNYYNTFVTNLRHHPIGFSDPVYAEAYVKVHGFDILLGLWGIIERSAVEITPPIDVLIVNQTTTIMQNLCLEFATLGDLKLVEKPSTHTLAPHSFHSVKTSIKVCFHLFTEPELMCCRSLPLSPA
jgi:coatomer subunit beta